MCASCACCTPAARRRIDSNRLRFEQCDSLTLLVDARTNYKPDYKAGWRGDDPLPLIEKELARAQAKPYEELRAAHVKDLSALLRRVTLDIGGDRSGGVGHANGTRT